jgi:pimeloyl-ACP methyl ester carboxylesterase
MTRAVAVAVAMRGVVGVEQRRFEVQFVPLLFRQFEDQPSSIGPFLQLNADVIPAVLAATERAAELRTFPAPVRAAFGEHDTYLSAAYGQRLAALCAHGEATPITGAAHFPQFDAPTDVARAISTPHRPRSLDSPQRHLVGRPRYLLAFRGGQPHDRPSPVTPGEH